MLKLLEAQKQEKEGRRGKTTGRKKRESGRPREGKADAQNKLGGFRILILLLIYLSSHVSAKPSRPSSLGSRWTSSTSKHQYREALGQMVDSTITHAKDGRGNGPNRGPEGRILNFLI